MENNNHMLFDFLDQKENFLDIDENWNYDFTLFDEKIPDLFNANPFKSNVNNEPFFCQKSSTTDCKLKYQIDDIYIKNEPSFSEFPNSQIGREIKKADDLLREAIEKQIKDSKEKRKNYSFKARVAKKIKSEENDDFIENLKRKDISTSKLLWNAINVLNKFLEFNPEFAEKRYSLGEDLTYLLLLKEIKEEDSIGQIKSKIIGNLIYKSKSKRKFLALTERYNKIYKKLNDDAIRSLFNCVLEKGIKGVLRVKTKVNSYQFYYLTNKEVISQVKPFFQSYNNYEIIMDKEEEISEIKNPSSSTTLNPKYNGSKKLINFLINNLCNEEDALKIYETIKGIISFNEETTWDEILSMIIIHLANNPKNVEKMKKTIKLLLEKDNLHSRIKGMIINLGNFQKSLRQFK